MEPIRPAPILSVDDEYCVVVDAARPDNGYGKAMPAAFFVYHRVFGFVAERAGRQWGEAGTWE